MCDRDPEMTKPYTVGVARHPLALPRNQCKSISIAYRQYCYLVSGCNTQGYYRGEDPAKIVYVDSVGESLEEQKVWRKVKDVLVRIEVEEMTRKLMQPENWGSPYERWIIDNTARNLVASATS